MNYFMLNLSLVKVKCLNELFYVEFIIGEGKMS